MKIRREEHMAGGNGHVIIKEILDAEQLNGKCGLYAQVTLEPGCSLGYHAPGKRVVTGIFKTIFFK